MDCIHTLFYRECDDSLNVQISFDGPAGADLIGLVGFEAVQRQSIFLRMIATVRSPSSFAARKMRMAISLRLAASNFWIGRSSSSQW
jgi:hypothetical protein